MRHCQLGDETDTAKAVDKFIGVDMIPKVQALEPLALEVANDFREQNCYIEETSDVLLKYAPSLKVVFERYALGSGNAGKATDDKKLLGIEEFRDLVLDLLFVDSQFAEREAQYCFVTSRMRVIRESDTRGRAKLLQLTFEDFLEAVVRMASIKAMPLDKEVRVAGCIDAGEYLLRLQLSGRLKAIDDFLVSHDVPTGKPPIQPIHRSVEHLVTLILRSITTTMGRPTNATDLKLSEGDLKAFHRGGGRRKALTKAKETAAAPAAAPVVAPAAADADSGAQSS